MYVGYQWTPEEDIGVSGTEITESCELLCVGNGTKLRSSARARRTFLP